MQLNEWLFPLRAFREMQGEEGGEVNASTPIVEGWFDNIGATVMGRNMFGGGPGPWEADPWTGFWGENPPYHHPVFVLTQYAREPLEMQGGTTFHFVTDGIHAALARAQQAAGGRDVRLGGGVATVRQCLREGLVDEMHLAMAPVLLGAGEALFAGIDLPGLGYQCTEHVSTPNATHVVLTNRRARSP
jgi:dihydrofolate reductase